MASDSSFAPDRHDDEEAMTDNNRAEAVAGYATKRKEPDSIGVSELPEPRNFLKWQSEFFIYFYRGILKQNCVWLARIKMAPCNLVRN